MNVQADSELCHPMWDILREHLVALRHPIQEEIRRYPPPIPACDAHFNHLLERRATLSRELVRLEAACRERGGARNIRAAEDFIRSSPCLDEKAARQLLRKIARGG